DRLRGTRHVRRAPTRADPPGRLGLSDPRRVRGPARPGRPGAAGGRCLPDAGAAARRGVRLRRAARRWAELLGLAATGAEFELPPAHVVPGIELPADVPVHAHGLESE